MAKIRDGNNSYREILRNPLDGKLRYHMPTGAIEYTHVKSGEVRMIGPGNWKYAVLS